MHEHGQPQANPRRLPYRLPLAAATLVLVTLLVAGGAGGGSQPPTGPTKTCVTSSCHGDLVNRRFVHAPTARQKCVACHIEDEPREHRFRPTSELDDLCTTCHVPARRTYTHAPVRDGECVSCHDPHGSDRPLLLHDDPTGGLCLSCHEDHSGADALFVHGPVETGACILCHEAHASWQPILLTEPPQSLCGRCHQEVVAATAASRHPHPPVETDCLACHDAHASDHAAQLRKDAPELCFECHDDIRQLVTESVTVHGALTEAGGCRQCHLSHGSELPALQRQTQSELCLSCHDEPVRAADGRMITNMAALLQQNPNHHGPIRDGACSACHLPHAAAHRQLLLKAYPTEFYADFEPDRYALCFDCHIPEMVTSSEGAGLTRFRDGNLNLHWLHVNRDRGRTCRACHEVHASRHAFHMRDSVPYGNSGWALEINFETSDTGGSCRPGCHEPTVYARGDDLGVPPPTPLTGSAP